VQTVLAFHSPHLVHDAIRRVVRPLKRRDDLPRGFLRLQALDLLIGYAFFLPHREGWWERRVLPVPLVTDEASVRAQHTMLDATPIGGVQEWVRSWNSPATRRKHELRREYLHAGAEARARDRLEDDAGVSHLYGPEAADVLDQLEDKIGFRMIGALARVGVFADIADDIGRLAAHRSAS
jgi:hypothetical protein